MPLAAELISIISVIVVRISFVKILEIIPGVNREIHVLFPKIISIVSAVIIDVIIIVAIVPVSTAVIINILIIMIVICGVVPLPIKSFSSFKIRQLPRCAVFILNLVTYRFSLLTDVLPKKTNRKYLWEDYFRIYFGTI